MHAPDQLRQDNSTDGMSEIDQNNFKLESRPEALNLDLQ